MSIKQAVNTVNGGGRLAQIKTDLVLRQELLNMFREAGARHIWATVEQQRAIIESIAAVPRSMLSRIPLDDLVLAVSTFHARERERVLENALLALDEEVLGWTIVEVFGVPEALWEDLPADVRSALAKRLERPIDLERQGVALASLSLSLNTQGAPAGSKAYDGAFDVVCDGRSCPEGCDTVGIPPGASVADVVRTGNTRASDGARHLLATQPLVDVFVVSAYMRAMCREVRFPSVAVLDSGQPGRILDGHHRYVASRSLLAARADLHQRAAITIALRQIDYDPHVDPWTSVRWSLTNFRKFYEDDDVDLGAIPSWERVPDLDTLLRRQ